MTTLNRPSPERLAELVTQKHTDGAIAVAYGVSTASVQRWRKEAGIPAAVRGRAPKPRPSPDELHRLYQRHTLDEVSAILGISRGATSRWLKEAGIETRGNGQKPPLSPDAVPQARIEHRPAIKVEEPEPEEPEEEEEEPEDTEETHGLDSYLYWPAQEFEAWYRTTVEPAFVISFCEEGKVHGKCPICGGEADAMSSIEPGEWQLVQEATEWRERIEEIDTTVWCGSCGEELRLRATCHTPRDGNEWFSRFELTSEVTMNEFEEWSSDIEDGM